MSPQDPLEQLLNNAFDAELRQLKNVAVVDEVMILVRRKTRVRAIVLTIFLSLAMAVLVTTLPDLAWLTSWLRTIQVGNLTLTTGLALFGLLIPWLVIILDDRV